MFEANMNDESEKQGPNNKEQQDKTPRILFNTRTPGFVLAAPKSSELKNVEVATSLCPLREIDPKGKEVESENLESSELVYNHEFIESKDNNTLIYSTHLPNGAFIEVHQTVFLKPTNINFPQQHVVLHMNVNSIKISFQIDKWPFKNMNNRLELCIVQTSSSNISCSINQNTQVIHSLMFD